MSGDFYKDWRTKAEVDYFPQLVVLWLSTNAWYRSHYSEITTRKDRDFLNKLRNDQGTLSKIYTRFERLPSVANTKELRWDEQTPSSVMPQKI